jgi:hypothetical protein
MRVCRRGIHRRKIYRVLVPPRVLVRACVPGQSQQSKGARCKHAQTVLNKLMEQTNLIGNSNTGRTHDNIPN